MMSVSRISLDADSREVAEWHDPGVEISIDLSEPALRAVEVTLEMGGTATPGGDYELVGSVASESEAETYQRPGEDRGRCG